MKGLDFFGGLSVADIAEESYGHAIMFMYSDPIKGLAGRFSSWNESAKAIDISPIDTRIPRFRAIWNLVGRYTGNPLANRDIFKRYIN